MTERTDATGDAASGAAHADYTGPDRRIDHTARAFRVIHDKLRDGELRMDKQDLAIAENTKLTQGIKDDTSEIVEFAQSMKGVVRVAEMVGKLAKPLGYILAAFAAGMGVITSLKSGGWGHWGGGR